MMNVHFTSFFVSIILLFFGFGTPNLIIKFVSSFFSLAHFFIKLIVCIVICIRVFVLQDELKLENYVCAMF
jgi:hypothetical protein